MKLKPLSNEVLVKLPEESLALMQGVWAKSAAPHEKGAVATVVARGPRTEMVHVGALVLIPPFSGKLVRSDKGGNYKLIRETDILAFMEDYD